MEKIHKNIRVFMLSCIKHACFQAFSPFSAYFSPHDIIAEKGLLPVHYIYSHVPRPTPFFGYTKDSHRAWYLRSRVQAKSRKGI